MNKIISTDKAPKAIGPYSQAYQCGNTLYCSGQIAINPQTNEFIGGTIEEQTEQILKNIGGLLEAAGYGFGLHWFYWVTSAARCCLRVSKTKMKNFTKKL